ncbi:serine/threonine-protein phosphatase 7 long form [Dorcoceras hygrometricum]|uniref:Serine/threonine-protein phosphatase 7 long form n=1 Tax=Dorcoceras hygrometricum TaxID=472368 RepID=A0A2Z7BAX4_9LAMI|nr:serine/threonine-protein phosphatase 7 long form [Dorcoceras hygrometricum]
MDSVALLLYIGGNIIIEHNTVQYSTSATKATRVSRSISFRELKEKVYRLLNIDSSKFTLKLSSKYSFNDKSRYVEAHLEIDDDNNLQFMLDISNDVQCLELFIETEPIERHVAVDDPESYIPRITQGLNALGFNSVGYNEDASTSAFAWHGATDQNRYTSDHDIGDWDHSKFTLKLSSKYSFNDKSRYVEAHLEIDDNNNLQFMLDISNEMQCIELFIETEPIDRHVAVDDPESYIPRITQGLNALRFNSVGYNEDASTSAFAWHGATDQNRYNSDHDIGDWDQYVRPTLEENVSWPFSSARQWSFVDDPLDISRNAHIGSSVGAIPRDIGLGRSNPHVDHEDHGLHDL